MTGDARVRGVGGMNGWIDVDNVVGMVDGVGVDMS